MDQVGDFRITRALGEGGMGLVFAAECPRFEVPVALKVLRPESTVKEVKRFQAEAKAVARLEHPNVIRVFEQRQSPEGHHYMAMELVKGEALDLRVKREGPVPPEAAAEMGVAMASALAAAHAAGVLHRDLKPSNVLIDGDDRVVLTDFGLAKVVGSEALTRTGEVLGTPVYMAPEQALAQREDIDVRTDVYGLGATLYHVLTGRLPFQGKGVTQVLTKIVRTPPRPLREVRPEIPEKLEAVVLRCMEKDQAKRYPSAEHLERALQSYLGGGGFLAWLRGLFGG
jgi:eukaryotic-like serine/threonine-protein kinase